MHCERCGLFPWPAGADRFDYCGECGANLCAQCMREGCCGSVPALSGMACDHATDAQERAPQARPKDGDI
jgi:hypothetical protein